MAIALTRFQGLCGFRPVEEIQGFLRGESGTPRGSRSIQSLFLLEDLLTPPRVFV